jgi:hypothetical protein
MDGRNTTSTLKLIPTAKDHDAELICSAFNPVMIPASNRNVSRGGNEENHLAGRTLSSSVETRRKLVVHCKNQLVFFLFSFSTDPLPPPSSQHRDTRLDDDEWR